MNLAKVSRNGQITLPKEIRETLKVNEGDKVLFTVDNSGDVVVANPKINALKQAQKDFVDFAEKLGIQNEEDLQNLVNSVREDNDNKIAHSA